MNQTSTVQKAIELLFHLNSHTEPLGVSEIAQHMNSPKTSTHRLLQSLRYRDLVQQDCHGRYFLGSGTYALSTASRGTEVLVREAREPMVRAATALGETFFLVSAGGGQIRIVDKVEGSGFLRVSPRVGACVPVHATAVGKVYLGHAPRLVAMDGLALHAYTSKTITDRAELERIAALDRERGFCVSQEEWQDGLSAIAAPILVRGQLAGALVAGLIAPRLTELGMTDVAQRVVQTASEISTAMETNA